MNSLGSLGQSHILSPPISFIHTRESETKDVEIIEFLRSEYLVRKVGSPPPPTRRNRRNERTNSGMSRFRIYKTVDCVDGQNAFS